MEEIRIFKPQNLDPKTRMQKVYIPIIIIAVILGFWAGTEYQKTKNPNLISVEGLINQELGKSTDLDFSLFWNTWNRITEKYVDRDKINEKDLLYGAISGMVSSLKDPYTVFFPPEQAKRFQEEIQGEFGGVGIEIGLRDQTLTVIAPIDGTPAAKAGLLAGDKIQKIDDLQTNDMPIDKAVSLIRGKKGTKVILTILRNGDEKSKDYTLVRDTIKVPVITKKIIEGNIGYIQLHTFNQNAGGEFRNAVNELKNKGMNKLILDLRNNPGGLLDLAIEISSYFLEPNKIVVIEDFGNNKKNELKSETNGLLKDIPLVILINKGSASASEILAGALHDQKGTVLIGEKSFGKGSVQQVDDLKGGASLKVTVAKWLTPKGQSISEQGIEPDIKIELDDEDQTEKKDSQLDKAIEIIKNL